MSGSPRRTDRVSFPIAGLSLLNWVAVALAAYLFPPPPPPPFFFLGSKYSRQKDQTDWTERENSDFTDFLFPLVLSKHVAVS